MAAVLPEGIGIADGATNEGVAPGGASQGEKCGAGSGLVARLRQRWYAGVSCWLLLKWIPHPCGYYVSLGDVEARQCRCSVHQIKTFRQQIFGPLLDRIDIHVEVPLVHFRELFSEGGGSESSATIRECVITACRIQAARFPGKGAATNAAMDPKQMKGVFAQSCHDYRNIVDDPRVTIAARDKPIHIHRLIRQFSNQPNMHP